MAENAEGRYLSYFFTSFILFVLLGGNVLPELIITFTNLLLPSCKPNAVSRL